MKSIAVVVWITLISITTIASCKELAEDTNERKETSARASINHFSTANPGDPYMQYIDFSGIHYNDSLKMLEVENVAVVRSVEKQLRMALAIYNRNNLLTAAENKKSVENSELHPVYVSFLHTLGFGNSLLTSYRDQQLQQGLAQDQLTEASLDEQAVQIFLNNDGAIKLGESFYARNQEELRLLIGGGTPEDPGQ